MISLIEGVKITPLKIISDDRGSVMHMMRSDSPILKILAKFTFQLYITDQLKPGTCTKKQLLITHVFLKSKTNLI